MQKIILSLLFIISTSIPLISQRMPDLNTIVDVFFEKYYSQSDVGFERRPDGYYVGFREFGQTMIKQEKIYDASSHNYIPLNQFNTYNVDTVFTSETVWRLLPSEVPVDDRAQNYLQKLGKYELDAFARQPYYGYARWYIDAISFFEQKESLTDDELNALARAYYQAGANLLSSNTSHYTDGKRFDLPYGQNALSSTQLSAYLYYHNKCIAAYEDLMKRNQEYITPVGGIRTKYANEVMGGFLTLLYYQNETSARKLLQSDIYDEYLLKAARNILRSCPPDAILFTYGDSDTYPLYYVQAVDGFRTDVIIANLSLLAVPRYRNMLLNSPLGAKALETGLPDFYYEDQFVFWGKTEGDNDHIITMDKQYTLFKRNDLYYGESTPVFMDKHGGGYLIDVPAGTNFYKNQSTNSIMWRTSYKESYIYPRSIFQIDILHKNHWERPLCFSLTVRAEDLEAWAKHLVLEGMIYRIYPDSLEAMNHQTFNEGTVNLEYNLSFWENEMEYDTNTVVTDLGKVPFYQKNILSAYRILDALYKVGENEKAIDFMNNFIMHFPNTIKPWDDTWLLFVDLLEKQDSLGQATTIVETIISNYENHLFDDMSPVYYQHTLIRLKIYAENQQLKGLIRRCEGL